MSHEKVMCSLCNVRPARFSRHGVVKADADHNMCLQCFRSVSEKNFQNRLKTEPFDENMDLRTQIKWLRKRIEKIEDEVFKLRKEQMERAEKTLMRAIIDWWKR